MSWLSELFRDEHERVLRALEYIIDRCDNSLANIAYNDERREVWFRLAFAAFRCLAVYRDEVLLKGFLGEVLPISKPVISIAKQGVFEGKTIEDLIREGVIKVEYRYPRTFKELIEKGYVEVNEENLEESLELAKQGYAKLVLVPKSFEVNPLFFKRGYRRGDTDVEKVKRNIKLIEELIRELPEAISKQLIKELDDVKKAWLS